MFVIPPGDLGQNLPIKIWGSEDAFYADAGVMEQVRNLANLPIAEKYICLMPDYHKGYGMPIGGVLATRGGVVPNAVGVDIGCGMIAAKTELKSIDLSKEWLQALRVAIHRRVPTGNAAHKTPVDNRHTKRLEADLFSKPSSAMMKSLWWDQKPQHQMGTLGGGNHFIEIQRDPTDDSVWIMIHSGSRNLGLQICNHYHAIAKKYMEMFHSKVPTLELSFLPDSTQEYTEYITSMEWAMLFAKLNRLAMLDATLSAFEECKMPVALSPKDMFDTHHNFARMENHFGQNLMIHRKGSVHAKGRVTIPGSMGTSSYIGEGLENPLSFNTCSHGAGRVLSRKAASDAITIEEAQKMMEHVVFGTREGMYDEHPHAYKDLEDVMQQQQDLVKPLHKLLPLAVVKG